MIILASLTLAVGYYAGRKSISTSPDTPADPAPATIEASSGTLVEQRPVQVLAQWKATSQVTYRRPGTITSTVLTSGSRSEVTDGAVLYRLDQVPVVAMAGTVPAYRDLGAGIKGADVEQFQSFLVAEGADIPVDGTWGSATTQAWKEWQRSTSLEPQAGAPLGTVLFFDDLPVTVTAGPQHRIGSVIGPDDVAFEILDRLPTFAVALTDGSTTPLDTGSTVTFTVEAVDFELEVTGERTTTDDGTVVGLGSSVPLACASWCDELDASNATQLAGTVTLAGPAEGTIIPTGVIRTKENEQLFVVDANGVERPITIVLQVGGNAIVEGIEPGTSVEVPGLEPA